MDDLLLRGYKNLTVLDVSPTAIEVTKKRVSSASEQVCWLVGDIVEIELEPHSFDLCHDRAVSISLRHQNAVLPTFDEPIGPMRYTCACCKR